MYSYEKKYLLRTTKASLELAKILCDLSTKFRIFAFDGELGSGKSFLCHAITRILLPDASKQFSSPSFNIVNIYGSEDKMIYHIDLYRIITEEQICEIGILDILETGNIVLIEWPNIIGKFLQSYDILYIKLSLLSDNTRVCYLKYSFSD